MLALAIHAVLGYLGKLGAEANPEWDAVDQPFRPTVFAIRLDGFLQMR
jgi:hypothetical protein